MNWLKGREAIKEVLNRYPNRLKEEKPRTIIDLILWSVAREDGMELANSLILQFELHESWMGAHTWFDDEATAGHDPHVCDPNWKVPDEWRILPGDERHPGEMKL